MKERKRLKIIIGAYGSGKSEISVNLALKMRREDPKSRILMADLDIVNPFYRSADAAKVLKENDIRLISPMYANSNVDAPVLSGEVYVIFDDEEYDGVFDIGGEDMGATILGSMRSRLEKMGAQAELWMAVNTRRPFTRSEDDIIEMAKELEAASKIAITGFINNTNILEQTTPEDVLEGEEILRSVSGKTGVPLVMTAYMDGVVPSEIESKIKAPEILKMRRTINYAY